MTDSSQVVDKSVLRSKSKKHKKQRNAPVIPPEHDAGLEPIMYVVLFNNSIVFSMNSYGCMMVGAVVILSIARREIDLYSCCMVWTTTSVFPGPCCHSLVTSGQRGGEGLVYYCLLPW